MSRIKFVLIREDGARVEHEPAAIESITELSRAAPLKFLDRTVRWFTWIGGRCERLCARPSETERWVVKIVDPSAEGGGFAMACRTVEVKVAS